MKAQRLMIYIILLILLSLFATYNILYLLSLEEPATYSVIANINGDGELGDISFNNLTKINDKTAFIVINYNNYPVKLSYEEKGEVFKYTSIDKITSLKPNEEKQTYMNIKINDIENRKKEVLTGKLTIYSKKSLFWFFS